MLTMIRPSPLAGPGGRPMDEHGQFEVDIDVDLEQADRCVRQGKQNKPGSKRKES